MFDEAIDQGRSLPIFLQAFSHHMSRPLLDIRKNVALRLWLKPFVFTTQCSLLMLTKYELKMKVKCLICEHWTKKQKAYMKEAIAEALPLIYPTSNDN